MGFALTDNEDGTADLFHDGVFIGTLTHKEDHYVVGPLGAARATAEYAVSGIKRTDSDAFMEGNEYHARMWSSTDELLPTAPVGAELRAIRGRWTAAQVQEVREGLADGTVTLDDAEEYLKSVLFRVEEDGVSDFKALADGLRSAIVDHKGARLARLR